MTPKEKAKDLFNKMYQVENILFIKEMDGFEAKQCALICVDEILKECSNWAGGTNDGWDAKRFYYWNEVRNEIEKL